MAAELSGAQQEAVEHLSGRLLITAGAGSGKTRTLAERFAHAVISAKEKDDVSEVDRILTITYTEKAAGELAERVRSAFRGRGMGAEARSVDGAWISTIHTFCTRVLKREALVAGIDPGFTIIDEVEAAALSMEAFEQVALARIDAGCPGTTRLFELYGYGAVRRSVVQIAGALHARGVPVREVEVEDAETCATIIREAQESFAAAGECFAAYTGAAASPGAHHAACSEALECLGGVDESRGVLAAEETLRILLGYSARRNSTKDTRETVDRLMETRDDLAERCTRLILKPLGETLLGLVGEYMAASVAIKRERGAFDFDDLIVATRDLFERKPAVLERYRARFRMVMVDEFQDTDAVQLAFIEAVGAPDLATVGDVRQSIYSFRGADVGVYRRHREEMAAAGAVRAELAENYRSHSDIIEFVNGTFGTDALFGEQDTGLVAGRTESGESRFAPGEPRIELRVVDTSDGVLSGESLMAEADIMADCFARMRERGFEASEMAVLVRAYADAQTFATALERAGFGTTVVGGDRFFELHEVAALRALTSVIANPHDDEALLRVLVSDVVGVNDDVLAHCAIDPGGGSRAVSLWDGMRTQERMAHDSDETVQTVVTAIENARLRVGTMSLATVILKAVEELGFAAVLAGSGVKGRLVWANVVQFCRKAAAFERGGGAGAAGFVASLDAEEASGLRQSATTSVGDGGSVTIMSIHAAKGLEFPVVGVPTLGKAAGRSESGFSLLMVDDDRATLALRLPASFGSDNTKNLLKTRLYEESCRLKKERDQAEAMRLFYVACTRAREALVLTGAGVLDKLLEAQAETPLSWLVRAHGPGLLTRTSGQEEGEPCTVLIGSALVGVEVTAASGAEGYETDNVEVSIDRHVVAPVKPVIPLERERPRPVLPDRISYSDIELYRRCSLRYWAERVAHMKKTAAPEAEAASTFGSALHVTLQLAGETAAPLSDERIAAIARGLRLSEGQGTRLRDVVRRYLDSAHVREVDGTWERSAAEVPFAIRLGDDDGPLLVGAIDRYAVHGADALVLDYKSGTGRGAEVAIDSEKRDARYRLQAECYALVSLRQGAERVTARFVFPESCDAAGEPHELVFEFCEEDGERIESALLSTWERMGSTPYTDRGVWSPDPCGDCPASGTVCRVTPPRRGAG